MKKILFVLFLVTGFLFFFSFTPKIEAFKITMLSKIPGQRIIKDYRMFIFAGDAFSVNGVLHATALSGISLTVNFTKFIINSAPSGANACIDFSIPYGHYSCEYVKLTPKK